MFGEKKVFSHPAVHVEVKSNNAFDIPFLHDRKNGGVKLDKLKEPSKHLLYQFLQYIHLEKAPELPWDHIYLITMTGSVARIWKFTPTGCTVTSTIRYLERPDDLLRFVHALALNGRRGLGLCVGSDRLFRDVGFTGTDSVANDYEVDLTKKLEKIARIYVQYSNNKQWAERQRLTSVWVLNVTSNSRFRTEGVDNPPPGPQGDDLLVLQHPITRRVSMFLACDSMLLGNCQERPRRPKTGRIDRGGHSRQDPSAQDVLTA